MRADKRMLYEFHVPESNVHHSNYSKDEKEEPINVRLFRDHLLRKSKVCQELQSHSLAELWPGARSIDSTFHES